MDMFWNHTIYLFETNLFLLAKVLMPKKRTSDGVLFVSAMKVKPGDEFTTPPVKNKVVETASAVHIANLSSLHTSENMDCEKNCVAPGHFTV